MLENFDVIVPETDLDDSDEHEQEDENTPLMQIPETDYERTDDDEACDDGLEHRSKMVIKRQRTRRDKVAEVIGKTDFQ